MLNCVTSLVSAKFMSFLLTRNDKNNHYIELRSFFFSSLKVHIESWNRCNVCKYYYSSKIPRSKSDVSASSNGTFLSKSSELNDLLWESSDSPSEHKQFIFDVHFLHLYVRWTASPNPTKERIKGPNCPTLHNIDGWLTASVPSQFVYSGVWFGEREREGESGCQTRQYLLSSYHFIV